MRDDPSLVELGYRGSVAIITLHRPQKGNALTAQMVESLLAAVNEAGMRSQVKAIVLTAEGDNFCAGFDVANPRDFEGSDDDTRAARLAAIRQKADWMRELLLAPKPLVASVRGACIGIGTYLVMVADFAVAARSAAFGFPEERFGSAGATWAYPFLIQEVGLKRATELVMTGRRVDADEMAALGLITRAVDDDDLDAVTDELTAALCSLPREGIAVNRTAKRLALSMSGHLSAFEVHAPVHGHAERMRREPDEFDFMAVVAERGMRAAVAERNTRFAGSWWGW